MFMLFERTSPLPAVADAPVLSACVIPVRRAMRLDPAAALRVE
jgi:hypothetical protein